MLADILLKPLGFISKNADINKLQIFLCQITVRGGPSDELDQFLTW